MMYTNISRLTLPTGKDDVYDCKIKNNKFN